MRWHTPATGASRIVKMFAWFPIECLNGDGAWLETVFVRQGYDLNKGWYNSWLSDEKAYTKYLKELEDAEALDGMADST